MKNIQNTLAGAALFIIFNNAFADEPPMLNNDPKRPVDKISKDLNISAEQFVACFNNVKPAAQGSRPTSEKVHANKEVLLPCLQKANPKISNEMLDAVMDKYRPGGHQAQEPSK